MELRDGPGVSKKRLRRMRIRKKNSKQWATSTLTDRDLAAIAMSKIEEAEYMPLAPYEPEMTLYRFRSTYRPPELPSH